MFACTFCNNQACVCGGLQSHDPFVRPRRRPNVRCCCCCCCSTPCRSKAELTGLLDCSIALKKAFKDSSSGIEVRGETHAHVHMATRRQYAASPPRLQHRRTPKKTLLASCVVRLLCIFLVCREDGRRQPHQHVLDICTAAPLDIFTGYCGGSGMVTDTAASTSFPQKPLEWRIFNIQSMDTIRVPGT